MTNEITINISDFDRYTNGSEKRLFYYRVPLTFLGGAQTSALRAIDLLVYLALVHIGTEMGSSCYRVDLKMVSRLSRVKPKLIPSCFHRLEQFQLLTATYSRVENSIESTESTETIVSLPPATADAVAPLTKELNKKVKKTRPAINDEVDYSSPTKMIEKIPREIWVTWTAAYDAEFLNRCVDQCFVWSIANPLKRSKTVSGLSTRLSRWIEREATKTPYNESSRSSLRHTDEAPA